MSHLISEIRAYFTYRRQTRTDFTFLYVIAALILIFGERCAPWVISFALPTLAMELSGLNYVLRIFLFGVPLAFVFLIFVWWLDWRSIKRDPVESHQLSDNPGEVSAGVIEEAQALPVIQALQKLRDQLPPIPIEYGGERLSQLSDAPTRFDPNRWFEVFPHLRPQAGFVLDFVYFSWGNGGQPLLYMRQKETQRLKSAEEYWQQFGGAINHPVPYGDKPLLDRLEYDSNSEGYFEFLVFYLFAPRFHLHRHSQAGEFEIIVSRDRLTQIISEIPEAVLTDSPFPPPGLTHTQREQIVALDPRPTIMLCSGGRCAYLTLLFWEPGINFVWKKYCISRPYPPQELEPNLVLSYGVSKIH